jgi:putative ABC transport system permease protein
MLVVDPAFYLHNYTAAQARQAALDLVARVRLLPGVDAATIATIPPLRRVWIEHLGAQQLYLNEVDPSYFPTMRLTTLEGRIFGAVEPDAAVVSESAARKLWPHESAIGKSCRIAQRMRTVTGVVKDSGVSGMIHPESLEVYLPIDDKNVVYATLVVHTTSHPGQKAGTLRSAATLPGIVPLVATFQSAVERQMDTLRKTVTVVGSLGAIASALALLGIFGLMAFTVAQKTREIGVRMALGARTPEVLRCVLGQYAMPVGIGACFGVALAAAGAKIVLSVLFAFIPFELASFAPGLLLFAAVALVAVIAPARRALRVDPASALRHE